MGYIEGHVDSNLFALSRINARALFMEVES